MRTSRLAFIFVLLAITTPVFGQKVLGQKKQPFPDGAWWRNQSYASLLSLTPDQQKKMDDVFQQSRIRLIDLTATLDKEEAILDYASCLSALVVLPVCRDRRPSCFQTCSRQDCC